MSNYAENRKARFDYEFMEEFEAGLELDGPEVKSVRAGKMSLAGSFVSVRGGEAFLLNAEVAPYQPKNLKTDYDPKRVRKLLMTKDELSKLATAEATKGLTIVPITGYA